MDWVRYVPIISPGTKTTRMINRTRVGFGADSASLVSTLGVAVDRMVGEEDGVALRVVGVEVTTRVDTGWVAPF